MTAIVFKCTCGGRASRWHAARRPDLAWGVVLWQQALFWEIEFRRRDVKFLRIETKLFSCESGSDGISMIVEKRWKKPSRYMNHPTKRKVA